MKQLILPLLFAVSVLSAQPKIGFHEGGSMDFGEIYGGSKITRTVTLRNEGTDTLKISNVSASCGCTAALVSSGNVAPHDSTALTITFNSGSYLGRVGKSVTVASNDPASPKLNISFSVDIKSVLKMNPQFLYYGEMKVDSTVVKSMRLQNATSVTVTILSVMPKDSQLTNVQIGQKTLKPGEETDLTAAFHPKQAGYVQGAIELQTDYTPYPLLSVNFNGMAKADLPHESHQAKKK